MTPYRICASVPPEPPDHDVLRYAACVRDERRRSAFVAGLLLTVSVLVALLAMLRPERYKAIVGLLGGQAVGDGAARSHITFTP